MKREPGFVIDVPITLSVAVRGGELTAKQAMEIARNFADGLAPSEYYVQGYMSTMKDEQDVKWNITEVGLESSREDSCEVLDELEEDEEGE